MICLEDARFILVRIECPYIQSSVTCVTDALLLNDGSRGYKQAGEGEAPKFLMRGWI
jgi:hypothetical protein